MDGVFDMGSAELAKDARQKWVAYLRCSKEEQATEGYSIEYQKSAIERFASLNNAIVVAWFSEIASGARSDRGELRKAIDMTIQAADALVVFKVDRAARSLPQLLNIVNYLEEHGKGFISVNEHFDLKNPVGRLVFNILASFAEWERETLRLRVVSAMKHRLLQGYFPSNSLPMGYKRLKDGRVAVDPKEAKIVQKIYHAYLEQGMSISKVAKRFGLSERKVRHILYNPAYKGELLWRIFDASRPEEKQRKRRQGSRAYLLGLNADEVIVVKVEPIVDAEVWEKVQKKLRAKGKHIKGGRPPEWFTGLCVCAQCGGTLIHYKPRLRSGEKVDMLLCATRGCPRHACIRLELFEKWVMRNLHNLLIHMFAELKERLSQRTFVDLSLLRQRKEQILQSFLAGLIDADMYQRALEQIAELEAMASEPVNAESTLAILEHFIAQKEDFADAFKHAPREIQRMLVQTCFGRVIVDGNQVVKIEKEYPSGTINLPSEPLTVRCRPRWLYEEAKPILEEYYAKGILTPARIAKYHKMYYYKAKKFIERFLRERGV